MKLLFTLAALPALACLASCAEPATEAEQFGVSRLALVGAACSELQRCAAGEVCVEFAGEPSANRCERPHALYSFLEVEPDGLSLAFDQVAGTWRTERALTPLAVVPYALQLADGTPADCRDSDSGPTRPCFVPDWRAYIAPSAIADKYDRFALFGLRPLRFLVSTWGHASDAQLSAMAASRGQALSPTTIRRNMRNTYLAAVDAFTVAANLPFALPADPAPGAAAGWLNPNGAFEPGMALWDPASNANCKTEKTVRVPGFDSLTYYDLRSSIWDRHATAFRALSLLNAYFHARGLLTPVQSARWLGVLHGLGDALALSSSFEADANHGITQAAALLQLAEELDGSTAARVAESDSLTLAWKDLARQRLNDVISDTILPDGAQIEQSLFYHNYELSFLIEIKDWLARHPAADLGAISSARYDYAICQNGTIFDDKIQPRADLDVGQLVDAATRVSTHTTMPSGDVPMLGSSPPANLTTFWETAFDAYVASDASDVAQQFEFVRTQGKAGVALPLAGRMQVFPSVGYVTLRSAFAPSYAAQTHLLFNTGAPTNAHSHLDTLSVHLYGPNPATPKDNDGLVLLTDSGWFSYTSAQRSYFESTSAHNTVVVDGLNQCSFEPGTKLDAPTQSAAPLANCAALSDGYPSARGHLGSSLTDPTGKERILYQSAEASLYPGVIHRRAVALIGRELVLVLDRLESQGSHDYSQLWHLGPSITGIMPLAASDDTGHYAFRDLAGSTAFSGHFSAPADSSFALLQGTCGTCSGNLCGGTACAAPLQGWWSKAENTKQPAWVLERRANGQHVTWASAFLLGSLAAQQATVSLATLPGADNYLLDVTLSDGLSTSLRISSLASPAESVEVAYPLRGAFASYSFEGSPSSVQDLTEGLALSVSAPGETTDEVSSRPGVLGNAYEYSAGSTALGSSGSFAFMHKPGAKFSLSFWLRMASANLGPTGGIQAVFSTGSWSNTGTGIQLYFQDDTARDSALRFVIRGGGGTPLSFSSPERFVPEDTEWHHYVLVFDATAPINQVRMYRDGGSRVTGAFSGTLSSASNDAIPTIGKKPGSGLAYPLHASLDELVAFKLPLSDADVTSLYNGGQGLRAH